MLTRFLRTLIWLASASAVVVFAFVVARRILNPLEYDPIEGTLLDFARRIAEHRPLYPEPMLRAPIPLMPGFPAVVALLVRQWGPQLWEPRAVSLGATLITTGLVFAIIRAETLSWTLAAAGVGLVLAGQGLIVGGPEIARPETLMLALVLAGFTTLRFSQGTRGALAAALLLSAACFTQASALWFVAGLTFYVAGEDRGRVMVLMPAFAVLFGGGYVLLSRVLGEWFNYHAWDLALASLRFDPTRLLQFLGTRLAGQMGVLMLAAVLSVALPTPPWRGVRGLWMWMGVGMLGAGLLTSQSPRTGAELLIPGVVVLAVLGSISLHCVARHLAAWPGSTRGDGHGIVLAALALQFLVILASMPPSLMNVRALTSDPGSPSPAPVGATAVSAAAATESTPPGP